MSRCEPSAISALIVLLGPDDRAISTERSRFSRALAPSPIRPKTRPNTSWARLAAPASSSRSARRSAFSAA